MKTRRIFRFGFFRLDATAKVLLRGDEPVHLTRKAVETLLVLVESTGQVVTKSELMAALWPDRVVDEANLAQNIAVVRKALAAEHGTPGHIETFPGRGYRILGPVEVADEAGEIHHEPAPQEAAAPSVARALPAAFLPLSLLAVVGVVAWFWIWQRGAPSTPEESRRIPVTRLAGQEQQPAVSRDGKSVAFVWERPGESGRGIWIQDADGSPPRRVSRTPGSYDSPAWSSDGRHLACLRFQDSVGEIVLLSVDGHSERVLAGVFPTRYGLPYRHLDWSPDGAYLVVDDAASAREPLGVFLVSLATGAKKRLTQPDEIIIGDVDPHFSPDGTLVSFIRAFHRARQELFTVPAGGGAPVQLTSDGRQVTGQDWMPDGRRLAISSNRSGEFRIWTLAYPPGRDRVPHRTGIYGDFPIQLSVARNAPELVYSVLQQDIGIWRLDLASPAGAPGRWTRVVSSSGQDVSPQYSPSGDRIGFRSDRSGEEQLWICDRDGGNPVQITRGVLHPSVPRWSPDGRAIVFNNAITRDILTARTRADGTWSVAPAGVQGIHPVFSPDGRWIFAGTMDAIVRIPSEGGAPAEVARVRGISLGASSDGKYIYFVREPSGTALWRVETATGRTERVLDGLVPYCSSCWALAPGGIYYLGAKGDAPGRQALYFHQFDTGREKVLTEYPEALSPIGSGPFSLSPDGRSLLCVRVDRSSADVFRVEPFR